MLVLTRKLNETIVIDGGIRITLIGIKGNKVRIGIAAPENIQVDREEIAVRRCAFDAPLICAAQR